MTNAKQKVDDLILEIEKGSIDPKEAWRKIKQLKEIYVQQYSEQSWHVYIGDKFQNVIYSILKGYFNRLKLQDPEFKNLSVLLKMKLRAMKKCQKLNKIFKHCLKVSGEKP